MDLLGKHLLGGVSSADGQHVFYAVNPSDGSKLQPGFHEALPEEVDQALHLADGAFTGLRQMTPAQRAAMLRAIAEEILALGDALLDRAHAETGLPMGRLQGERGRAVNQIRLFADLIEEGSWVQARIDVGDPERQPLPKPDVRSMLMPIGPVAVFGASNFPLAIGVAGTDTISALGAGCPAVVKAHPAHPGTSEMMGQAISRGLARTGAPAGSFSMLQGAGHAMGIAMVQHPLTRAVAFTGSFRGGRALFDAAASRPDPIPVYAEMGSVNPVFLLPGALAQRAEQIAQGYLQSVNLGVGQFCTNPGLVVGIEGESLGRFVEAAGKMAAETPAATMLHPGIAAAYRDGVQRIAQTQGVRVAGRAADADEASCQAACVIFQTDIATLGDQEQLMEEVFGPASIVASGSSLDDLIAVARKLDGHLTATVHGTDEDLASHAELIRVLETKVGRLIFNGFPTGIEVCAAMHHGGPYPATTDSHFTSIGTGAIFRFARPICYQNFPDAALPEELRNRNAAGVWRLVNNAMTQGDVA
ncbi:MAG: aldehyde dehydrogenase (NADP(+)) [Rhodothermales bacterium]